MVNYFLRGLRQWLCAALALSSFLLPMGAQAADFSVGTELNGSVATLWFKSNVSTSWVDAHYSVDGGAQQNLRMGYNGTTARFEQQFAASAGQVVQYSFTYNNGGAAYNTTPSSSTLQGNAMTAQPNFSPPGGSYQSAQSVSLSSSTAGATIRYTTDGSLPNGASAIYSGSLTVSASATIKAFASASGLSASPVASASYTIGGGGGGGNGFSQGVEVAGANATLWFMPAAGASWVDVHYNSGSGLQNMRMNYNTAAGRFEQSLVVSAGAVISYSFTYFVSAVGASDTALYTYTAGQGPVQPQVASPSMNPPGGSYTSAQSVSLSSNTAGASIRYTLDGSTPGANSSLYSGPISVSVSGTLKSIASKSGMRDSTVSSASYVITEPANSFVQGVSELGSTATLWFKPSAAMNFVILHYSIGSSSQINPMMAYNPTLARYETVLNVGAPGSVIHYAFTYAPTAGSQTDSASYSYIMGADNGIARPTFSPPGGSYTSAQTVTLASTVVGGSMRYTTDGSAPNVHSPAYYGAITVNKATTINAIAIASDQSESAIASATYLIGSDSGTVATPIFSHPAGSYATRISVNLLSATAGASVRFTTDGSIPTINSSAYGGPIELSSSATVKAIAFKNGMTPSAVASASYILSGTGSSTWNGQTTFNLVNATGGRWANNQVYWAIIGKDWASGNFVHVNQSGALVPISLGDNGALTKNGLPYANYFYTLDQLSSITIPAINSARLLISVGSPMYIWVNSDVNGHIGYAGANIENPSDPNTDVIFDFGEFAILPPGKSPQGIFINTTRVDQFGFPLQLTVTGLDGFKQTVGESLSESRNELFAKFIGELPPAFSALAQAPYAPYRIMAPSHATFQTGGASANYLVPTSPRYGTNTATKIS